MSCWFCSALYSRYSCLDRLLDDIWNLSIRSSLIHFACIVVAPLDCSSRRREQSTGSNSIEGKVDQTWSTYRCVDWPVSLPRVRRAEQSEARRPLIGHKLDTVWQGRLIDVIVSQFIDVGIMSCDNRCIICVMDLGWTICRRAFRVVCLLTKLVSYWRCELSFLCFQYG